MSAAFITISVIIILFGGEKPPRCIKESPQNTASTRSNSFLASSTLLIRGRRDQSCRSRSSSYCFDEIFQMTDHFKFRECCDKRV
ncbi:hypothetical protein B0H11DRAFT_708314 [Mycena galericulata]|nr:hypothetical protein B0H11DRAFT_708314 [Mycena galericulata]